MKKRSEWKWTLAALPVLVLAPRTEEGVGFHPEEGSSWQKSFTLKRSMTTDSSAFRFGEQEMNSSTGVVTHRQQDFVVLDEYVKVGEGRPQELVRTFGTVERSGESENVPDMVRMSGMEDYTSELEGHTVVFRWDEEDEEYEARFAEDDEGDEDWLDALVEDMDLRALLPEGDVSEGDTWSLEVEDFLSVLQPGGDLLLNPRIIPDDDDHHGGLSLVAPSVSETQAQEEMDGEVSLVYQGEEEEDGVRLARIQLSFKGETAMDAIDLMIEEQSEMGAQETDFQRGDVTLEMEGEGLLVWDVERGVARSFEFEAEVGYSMDAAWTIDFQGEELPLEMQQERSGTFTIRMQGEEPE